MKMKILTIIAMLLIGIQVIAQENVLPQDGTWTVIGIYSDDGACGDFAGVQNEFVQELSFEFLEDGNVFAISSGETNSTEFYNRVSDGVFSTENERMAVTVTLYSPDYFVLDLAFAGDLSGCVLSIAYGDSSSAPSTSDVGETSDTTETSEMTVSGESGLVYNDYVADPVCTVFSNNDETATPLCVQSANILLSQIGQVSDATYAMSILPDESAFLILNAGGMPENSTAYGSTFFAGPATYEISFDTENTRLFEEDATVFFPSTQFFRTEDVLSANNIMPLENYYPEVVFPLDNYIPGGDMFIPGGDMFIPGGDMFIPGGDMFVPGGDTFVPGGDTFIPGGDMFLVSSGISAIPGGDMFIPGGDMFIPGGDMFIPGGDMFFPEGEFELGNSYFASMMIDVASAEGVINQMVVVAVSPNPQSAEDVMNDIVNIEGERVRVYEIDPVTGTQTLWENTDYSSDSLTLNTDTNGIFVLYVFPDAQQADNAPLFMRYPPPQ